MKSLQMFFYLILITILFVGCEDLGLGGEGDPSGDATYVEVLVDDFINIFVDRSLTTNELEVMKAAIHARIKSGGLVDSEDLSVLMPLVASSAQVSLNTLGTDTEKIGYIKAISEASVMVVGNKVTSGTSQEDVASIVTSVSVAMVKNISATGIDPSLISETTQVTLSSIVGILDQVDLDDAAVLLLVEDISKESSVAVAFNSGVNTEILKATLGLIPVTASAATADITGFVLNDEGKKALLTATFNAVVQSLGTIKTDSDLDIDVATFAVSVMERTTEELGKDNEFGNAFRQASVGISDDFIKAAVGIMNTDSVLLAKLGEALVNSESIGVSEEEFDSAVEVVEIEEEIKKGTPDGGVLSTAEYESFGHDLLRAGGFEAAMGMFEKAIENDDVSETTKIWWSMLTLASISVDENVLNVMDNMGYAGYPRSYNAVLSGNMGLDEIEILDEDTYMIDGEEFTETYTYNMTVFPYIKNQEMFIPTYGDGKNLMDSQLMAMMYNLQSSYPNGLNDIVDSFIVATDKIDDVIDMLKTIPDDTSFGYSYNMFNDDLFDPDHSEWPSSLGETGAPEPMEILVGKAEVHTVISGLKLIKAMLFMGQSVSMSLDLDGYWDVFNPLTGTFYVMNETGKVEGLNPDFDWGLLKNPLDDEFLHARLDATNILGMAKVEFLDGLDNLQTASELLIDRDGVVEFFISPSNPDITEAGWQMVLDVQSAATVLVDKLVDSTENGTVIYLPDFMAIDDFSIFLDYSDLTNWPTSETGAYSINMSKLFEKPILTLENLFEIIDTGEFVFYTVDLVENVDTYITAKTFNESNTYYVKFNDITLNGFVMGVDSLITEDLKAELPVSIAIQGDNSVFIELPGDLVNLMVGHSLTPVDDIFVYNGEDVISLGTFFTPIMQMVTDLIMEEDEEEVTQGLGIEDRVFFIEKVEYLAGDSIVDGTPDSNVYMYFGEDGYILYVGQSDNTFTKEIYGYDFDGDTSILLVYKSIDDFLEYSVDLENEQYSLIISGSVPDEYDVDGDDDTTDLVYITISNSVRDDVDLSVLPLTTME